MYIQGKDNVFDLAFNDAGVTYGDVFLENEQQMSEWNFEVADTEALFDLFKKAAAECENCLTAKLPIPAYEQAIKASHIFNTLQARGRDLGRRAPGLHRPRPRPGQGRLRGVDGRARGRRRDAPTSCSSCCREEIPARMQARARNDLARMFAEELAEAGLEPRAIDDLFDAAAAGADRARRCRRRPRR